MILVLPLAAGEWIARRLAGRDVWFASHAEGFSLLPGKAGQWIRNAYYHLTLKDCPLNCCFGFGTIFAHADTEIGKDVYIGVRCVIGTASIGDDTMLADHVQILSGRHQHKGSSLRERKQDQKSQFSRVRVGRNCLLGANVIVMADIGDNCVIGAGSVVNRPIPQNSVAAGIPAVVIRSSDD
jgi:virginiamycin A acetyltransferase